jgi:polyphosphate kinase
VGASRGRIILKLNHLTDPAVLAALVEAAEAGAEVNLIVRSSLTLLHPLFKAKSNVSRFLAHARIAAFQVRGQWEIWMGSADWMPRNFDRRVELLIPILNPTVHAQVLDQVMVANLKDDEQSWEMQADGSYRRLAPGNPSFNLHRYFMTNPSLSGRGQALRGGTAPRLLVGDGTEGARA